MTKSKYIDESKGGSIKNKAAKEQETFSVDKTTIKALKSPTENLEEEGSVVAYPTAIGTQDNLIGMKTPPVHSYSEEYGDEWHRYSESVRKKQLEDMGALEIKLAKIKEPSFNKGDLKKVGNTDYVYDPEGGWQELIVGSAFMPKKPKMTKLDYLHYHKNMCEKMMAITAAKNADYTGASDDPFSNFREVETLGITSVEIGFLTRMSDKWSRIRSLVKSKGVRQVLDESLEDTIIDLANYLILFAGYLKSKE